MAPSSVQQLPSASSSLLVSPEDALVLLEAVRLGLIPRTTRRLTRQERDALVADGRVFIWEEEETGMQRWTDGRKWSCSRVVGEYLGYDEVAGAGPGRTRGNEGVPARRMPGGLIKQTFQTMMQLPGQNPKRFHVISYHTSANAHLLHRPSSDPQYSNLSLALWASPEHPLPRHYRQTSKHLSPEDARSREKEKRLKMYEDLLHGARSTPGDQPEASSSQGRRAEEGKGLGITARGEGVDNERERERHRSRGGPPRSRGRSDGWGEEVRPGSAESRSRRVGGDLPRQSYLVDSPTPSTTSVASSIYSSRSTSPRHYHRPLQSDPYPRRAVSSGSSSSLFPHPPIFGSSPASHSWPNSRPTSSSQYPQASLLSPQNNADGSARPLPTAADLPSTLPPLSSLVPPPTCHLNPQSTYYVSQPVSPLASEDEIMLQKLKVRL